MAQWPLHMLVCIDDPLPNANINRLTWVNQCSHRVGHCITGQPHCHGPSHSSTTTVVNLLAKVFRQACSCLLYMLFHGYYITFIVHIKYHTHTHIYTHCTLPYLWMLHCCRWVGVNCHLTWVPASGIAGNRGRGTKLRCAGWSDRRTVSSRRRWLLDACRIIPVHIYMQLEWRTLMIDKIFLKLASNLGKTIPPVQYYVPY